MLSKRCQVFLAEGILRGLGDYYGNSGFTSARRPSDVVKHIGLSSGMGATLYHLTDRDPLVGAGRLAAVAALHNGIAHVTHKIRDTPDKIRARIKEREEELRMARSAGKVSKAEKIKEQIVIEKVKLNIILKEQQQTNRG